MSVRNIIRIYTLRLPLKNPDSCCLATSVPSVDLWKLFLYVNVTICTYAFWVVIELIDHELS